MKYFKGIQLLKYPWVMFYMVAEYETPEEFESSEWASDPLVKLESDIEQVFGTYSYHIVDGEFVDRTESEMIMIEENYNAAMALKTDANRILDINGNVFTYDNKEFPMDEVSRLFYIAIKESATNHKVRTTSNEAYALNEGDRAAFYAAYIAKLLSITKHTV